MNMGLLSQDLNSVIAAVEEAAHSAIRDAEAGDYEGAARRLEQAAAAIRPVSEELEVGTPPEIG
jgi:hypothetical protein